MTKTIKTILLLIIIIFSFQIFVPTTLADEPESLEFKPQIPIPGSEFDGSTTTVGTSKTAPNEAGREVTTMYSTLLPRYIKAIYNYGIGIAAFLALAMIVAGGIIWLTSAGASEKISTAKSMISSSIIGLVLLLGTYTLLQIVNPALLSFKPIETEYIGVLQYVCCEYKDKTGNDVAEDMTSVECTEKKGTNIPDASANVAKTDCLKNGCCQRIYTYSDPNLPKNIVNCIITNSDYCTKLEDEEGDTNGPTYLNPVVTNWEFNPEKCSTITDCESITSTCNNKNNGDRCKNSIDNCFCYDEKQWIGKGAEGEPCGNEDPNGYCFALEEGEVCKDMENWFKDDFYGRKCEEGLECCYYDK
jgi:hypothetical protein